MPEFQLLRCMVALAGDTDQQVYLHRGRPILFPELILLQNLHGEEAVTEVYVVGTCEMSNDEATARLNEIYGKKAVNDAFPGARARLPTQDASVPYCTLPIYVPKPARPDPPEPKLRPLDQYTMTDRMPRVAAQPLPAESEPTAEEIAAHRQDDEGEDEDIDALMAQPAQPSRPTVDNLVQGRVAYRGQAAQARRRPDHLPDVAHKPRPMERVDHDRPKG
jgi:hypothetical protein